MRTTLATAGLLAGLTLAVVPLAPAAAWCDPELDLEGSGSGGCRNSCVENGERYERLRTDHGLPGPSYWDLFVCPM